MARSGWYNDNRTRAYPFRARSVGRGVAGPLGLGNLPRGAIVDAGFLLGPTVGYEAGTHAIFLRWARRVGDRFFLAVGTDCPGLLGLDLAFDFAAAGPDDATCRSDGGGWASASLSGSSASAGAATCTPPGWSGFLVVGERGAWARFLAGDGVVARSGGDATFEPATAQDLGGTLLASVSVANLDRTRVTAPAGCPDATWPYPTGIPRVAARCLTGTIALEPGYNAALRQDVGAGTLTLAARAGAGAGAPCTPAPLTPGEAPPEGSVLLEGGPQCNEVLRSLNGQGGRVLAVVAGPGAALTALPGEHRLVIDLSMTGLATCGSSESLSRVSQSL